MIHIHGNGLTALACLQLLNGHDARFDTATMHESPKPILLLSRDTLSLIGEIFGQEVVQDLGFPVATRTVIHPGQKPIRMPALSRSICLGRLIERIRPIVLERRVSCSAGTEALHIDATGRSAEFSCASGSQPERFGNRHVVTAIGNARATSAIMETTAKNWFFLFPLSSEKVALQIMCPCHPGEAPSLPETIGETTFIKSRVDTDSLEVRGSFVAAPQIISSIATENRLAVGAAAFALDPVCGDGVGSALRSALLAVAVIRSRLDNSYADLLTHYDQRHRISFGHHLANIMRQYEPLLQTPAWSRELAGTRSALVRPEFKNLLSGGMLRYAMNNGHLEMRN